MARNGSGTYSNPYPNFVSGTVISSSQVDANNTDIATALTQSIAVDGQSAVTADIPLTAHKLTGVSAGSAATDSLNLGQAQAEAFVWCGTAGGSANAITLAPTPAITAYAAGQRFVWMASGSVNTGATTVAVSGLSAIALQDNGAALVAGNHAASKMFMGILNTTSTMQIMQVQSSGTDPLIISSLTVNGASQLNGTLTAGVNDTGYDVKFFGATSGAYMLWDESADDLKLVGAAGLTVAGNIDIDGTTNLDAVDIDGAVQIDGIVQVGVDGTGYDLKLYGDTAGKSLLWDQSADSLIVTGTTTLVGTTNLDAVDIDGAVQLDSTLTVGVNDTGYDVKLFGATSGKSLLWDESADSLIVTGTTTLVGTTNLDAVDIDGATQIDGTVTVGVNDTGYDVKLFGATSGAYMLWDESADDLKLVGAAGLTVAGDIDVDGTTNLDAVDIDGAVQIDGTVTVGVNDTGYDVKLFGATSGAYMLWDESADDLKLVGAAGLTVAGDSVLASVRAAFVAGTSMLLLRNLSGNNRIDSYNEPISATYPLVINSSVCSFNIADSEKMRIDGSGNVFINQTARHGNTNQRMGLKFDGSAEYGLSIQVDDDTGSAINFANAAGTQVGRVSISGSAVGYITSSDYRLKENVVYDWDATTRLKQLKPSRFNFIVDPDTTVDGFLAHEAQAVVPECVTGVKDEVDADGNPILQGIDQSKIVPLLVKTIQELEARITTLEG